MKLNCTSGNRNGRRGFTLIEMLLVVTIIGILAAIVVPKLVGRGEDAKIKATAAQITAFKTALAARSEEHTSELQSHVNLVCRLLLEKKKKYKQIQRCFS